MKLNEEYLDRRTPYMLRNDGKVLGCPRSQVHPYFIGQSDLTKRTFWHLFMESLANGSLKWFFDNTNKEEIRDLIKVLVAYTHDDLGTEFDLVEDVSDFQLTGNEKKITHDEAVAIFNQLEYELNQEFLRVRTSDMYVGGVDDGIYFRVSSVGFNWFNLIWELVYENRTKFESVTIVKDYDSGKGSNEEGDYYSHAGIKFDHTPIDEFITIEGRPIIESLDKSKKYKKKLAEGSSLYEAFGHTRPERIVTYVNSMRATETLEM